MTEKDGLNSGTDLSHEEQEEMGYNEPSPYSQEMYTDRSRTAAGPPYAPELHQMAAYMAAQYSSEPYTTAPSPPPSYTEVSKGGQYTGAPYPPRPYTEAPNADLQYARAPNNPASYTRQPNTDLQYAGTKYTQGPVSQQYQLAPTIVVHQPVQTTLVTQVPDNMGLAIFACLCCCWPLGLVAICKAYAARSAQGRGDMASARRNSAAARQCSFISIGIGIGCIIFVFIASIFSNR